MLFCSFRFHLKESSLDSSKISQLTIHHTVPEDSGKYVCIATNPFGKDETVVQLSVQGKNYWILKISSFTKIGREDLHVNVHILSSVKSSV